MEQYMRRKKFITTRLNNAFNQMYLSDTILNRLYDDLNNPCKDLNYVLKDLRSIDAQKVFILLEYTKEREPVKYLAKIMRENNQEHVASALEEFNKSEEFIDYTNNEFLPVRHTDILRSGGSCRFEMESAPRGFCLILVNEKDLEAQAKQIACVFTQMYFNVRVECNKTALQIEQVFTEVAKSERYKGYNALVTVVMGHGGDGFFMGSKFDKNQLDKIPITHMIDIFAEDKCDNFPNKPKIFLFDCCRGRKCDKSVDYNKLNSTLIENINCFDQNWVNKNINTTVIYASAEGAPAYYSALTGFTYFGRAFTHSIAQFACEQNLDELIRTINKRLERDGIKQFPEVIHYKNRWNLYFNPGRIRIN